ncbi:unnamed protein product [Symbiodinium natans]|uniref:FCP1 homology domain-containing protein n=1 Tax=Symbiodinium natans TaxID=878477 RepID=A0A812RL47_9DINO|nr:unnamed protein product [Symbiodinium natans]
MQSRLGWTMDYLIGCGLPTVQNKLVVLRMPCESGEVAGCHGHMGQMAWPPEPDISGAPQRDLGGREDQPRLPGPLEPPGPTEQRRLLFLDVDGVLHPLQVRVLEQTQKVDMSHCFQRTCMQELRRVVLATGAQIILSSSWRKFEKTRDLLNENLAKYGLSFREWTTVAGGEGNDARVDQILAFVTTSGVDSWAVVDDEDLAPSSSPGSDSMMRCLFRQHFVRTDTSRGLDSSAADALIQLLNEP